MIVSLCNSVFYPSPVLSKPAFPVPASRVNYNTKVVKCLTRRNGLQVHFGNGYSKRRVYALSNNYEGLYEDPDDESDDDTEDEDEDEEDENDLDYESDWEGNGSTGDVVVSSSESDELSIRKYEEELIREVEQLLGPEEIAILEQNESRNLDKLSTGKWKPLHTFALTGQIKFMDGLLEKNYNIETVDKDGLTALHLAVIGKREAMISHLLRKGANPEAKDRDGATPLHYAAQVGAKQTVKLLMKYKVDVNVADNEGWTPLHVAMQTRNQDIAKILLVNGADRTRKNQVGNTPLDLSLCYGKEFKSYELSKLLKQVTAGRGGWRV